MWTMGPGTGESPQLRQPLAPSRAKASGNELPLGFQDCLEVDGDGWGTSIAMHAARYGDQAPGAEPSLESGLE